MRNGRPGADTGSPLAQAMNPQAPDGRRRKQHSGWLATTDPSTTGVYGFCVPRALPVRDVPARLPSVAMADKARSHGSGFYHFDAHDPVAGGCGQRECGHWSAGPAAGGVGLGDNSGRGLGAGAG